MVGFRENFSRCRYTVYLNGVQTIIPNLWSSFDVSITQKSGNERTGWVIWRPLRTIAHSLMVHARVSEAYINFSLMYTTDHIFPVIPIKNLMDKHGYSITSYKLATSTKPSVSHLRMLFCPCVVRKATAHIGSKSLNMRHHMEKITTEEVLYKLDMFQYIFG